MIETLNRINDWNDFRGLPTFNNLVRNPCRE